MKVGCRGGEGERYSSVNLASGAILLKLTSCKANPYKLRPKSVAWPEAKLRGNKAGTLNRACSRLLPASVSPLTTGPL
eukprot:557744-Rhodomonas_salina.3